MIHHDPHGSRVQKPLEDDAEQEAERAQTSNGIEEGVQSSVSLFGAPSSAALFALLLIGGGAVIFLPIPLIGILGLIAWYFGAKAIVEGVFELLDVNDRIRDLIREKAPLSAVKAEARKNGMLYMKEEALRLLARGTTSINELQRVVK